MKPKKIIKLLKEEARKLPKQEYYAAHKLSERMFQNIDGDLLNENEFKAELIRNPEAKFRTVNRSVEVHEVNLERQIKNIYKQYGLEACRAWFFVKMNKPIPPQSQTITEK